MLYLYSMKKIEDPKTQHRILKAIRNTGSLTQGYKAGGISEATFRRYRDASPEFDALVLDAKQYFKIQRSIKYGWEIRKQAYEYLKEEMRKGTLNHAVAFKLAYELENNVLG